MSFLKDDRAHAGQGTTFNIYLLYHNITLPKSQPISAAKREAHADGENRTWRFDVPVLKWRKKTERWGIGWNSKTQVHNILPLYDEKSRVLIAGSFPSVSQGRRRFSTRAPAEPLLADARRCSGRGNAEDGQREESDGPAPRRRHVGYHRLVRDRGLVRCEHHERCAERSVRHFGCGGYSGHFLQRRHVLRLL